MKFIFNVKIDAIGIFIERPNRFIAHFKLQDGTIAIAHVHDSGRIKELLFPGNKVLLRKAIDISKRKTQWDVIAALSDDGEEVLINSSIHRYITDNFFKDFSISPFGKVDSIKAEVKYGKSRLDYLLIKNNENIFIETKGVSLVENKIATFPDAPSIRATKHLNELIQLKKEGNRAVIFLIILKDADYFIPKKDTDPLFFETFYKALSEGVEVYPIQFYFNNGNIFYKNKIIKILDK